jgi:hypothetical protein
VVINNSDHWLGYTAVTSLNGSIHYQNLRTYIWQNSANGAEGVIFMDPYAIH